MKVTRLKTIKPMRTLKIENNGVNDGKYEVCSYVFQLKI